MTTTSSVPPADGLRSEIDTLLRSMPDLAQLAKRQPGEPDLPRVFYASVASQYGMYPMVHIPVYGRAGTLWVGRVPGLEEGDPAEQEVDALFEFGIRRVVCLVPGDALARLPSCAGYLDCGQQRFHEGFRHISIPDFGTPAHDVPFEHEVAATDAALLLGTPVLVHCMAGCGRTGTFVSSLMVRHGETPRSAIRRFRRVRGCGPETPEQVAYVFRYAQRLEEGLAAGQ